MATLLRIARRSNVANPKSYSGVSILRYSSTTTTTTTTSSTTAKPSHHYDHSKNQVYLNPTSFIGSWETPKDPKAAQAQLAKLRRDYAKQVKELRKQYIYDMKLQKQEKMRKDEALREEILRQREERKKLKAASAAARAVERKAFEDEFRQTLMKERAEKLEYWRSRQKAIEDKKNSKKELLRKQSSMWIDEENLEKDILAGMVDQVPY